MGMAFFASTQKPSKENSTAASFSGAYNPTWRLGGNGMNPTGIK